MELNKRISEFTGETLYYGQHPSGLKIYIIPKKGYRNNYAVFATKYGSVDSKFVVPGESAATEVPDGIAHYLEHKMFDQPDGSNVFDKFSKYGGNANAFTSFNETAFLFEATSNFNENLATLLDYVQSPYFTEESVEKERGIIGQEIKMYDDSAGWRVFFNMLGCLYHNHPVKKDIAGTVESISHITADYLYKCYNTFYNLSNMTLIISGDVEPDDILGVIERGIKKNEPFSEEIKRIYPSEPDTVKSGYSMQKLSVAAPLFMIGFKDTDTGYGGKRLLKKNMEITILLNMLFGKSSHIYKLLYDQGLINPKFAFEYTPQTDYAFSAVEGESQDPRRVYDIIIKELEKIKKNGLGEEDFERTKKVIWGEYIRTFNDVEYVGRTFMQLILMDINYFDFYDVYSELTFEDVRKRFEDHFRKELSALSVIEPA